VLTECIRPGSGCSTFLKAISNNRESYAAVEGDVSYGGIPAGKQKKQFRGEVNYNPEDDSHMADLNVWQTLKFALTNKTKKNEKHEVSVKYASSYAGQILTLYTTDSHHP
jgi:ABC-type multidrug transport system ATPase subunit